MGTESLNEIEENAFVGTDQGNRITEVVVFTGQALTKRKAEVKAVKGFNRFLIKINAFRIEPDSAQATVFGKGEILGVQYKEIPVIDTPQEKVRKLDETLETLRRQRKVLLSRVDAVEKQTVFLDSVIDFSQTEIPKKLKTAFPSTEELAGMVEFLGGRYQELADIHIDLDVQHEDLNKEIRVTERRLKRFKKPARATRKAIEVLFESAADQKITIDVTYTSQDAHWEPIYKVDVSPDITDVNLTMFAMIRQKTGEDWDDVTLSVSNAVPMKGAQLPDIDPWRVQMPSPIDYGGAVPVAAALSAPAPMAGKAGMAETMADYDLPEELEEEAEAEFTMALEKELPLAFEYELSQKIVMPSGGDETLLPLFTKKILGEFFIHAVPKIDPYAYLVCSASPETALLSGKLNVHFSGRFIGSTYLSEKKAGEDFMINLGVDRGVKIRREKITDKISETFLGIVDRNNAVKEIEYKLTLENIKEEPVRIQVIDAIPVSKTDRIQIKEVDFSMKPTTRDYKDKKCVMRWDLRVEPHATREISIKFFVKHPSDITPAGLA